MVVFTDKYHFSGSLTVKTTFAFGKTRINVLKTKKMNWSSVQIQMATLFEYEILIYVVYWTAKTFTQNDGK